MSNQQNTCSYLVAAFCCLFKFLSIFCSDIAIRYKNFLAVTNSNDAKSHYNWTQTCRNHIFISAFMTLFPTRATWLFVIIERAGGWPKDKKYYTKPHLSKGWDGSYNIKLCSGLRLKPLKLAIFQSVNVKIENGCLVKDNQENALSFT